MSIEAVALQSEELDEQPDGVRSYRYSWKVVSTTRIPLIDARKASGIPGRFERDPFDPNAFVINARGRRSVAEGKFVYFIDITTSTRPGFREEDAIENPLERPANIRLTSQKERRPVKEDNKGNPLTTKAGELLDNIEKDFTLWRLLITKNIPPSWPKWITQDYGTAVNSDSIRIKGLTFEKLKLQVDQIEIGETNYENGEEFDQLNLSFVFRSIGWNEKYLNFGKYELAQRWDSANNEFKTVYAPIIVDGKETDEPVPLDGEGRAFRDEEWAAEGLDVVKTQVDLEDITANLLDFDLTDLKPFSVFKPYLS